MRSHTHLSDFKILYICPSMNWGTLQRRMIQDAIYLRDSGVNIHLFCLKNSPISDEAIRESLEVHYHVKPALNHWFDYSYYRTLKKLIEDYNYDIVHVYGLKYVWPVCLLLNKKPLTPLLLTINTFLKRKFKTFFNRMLFSRVDKVITFDDLLKDVILSFLPVKKNRIQVLGTGIDKTPISAEKDNENIDAKWKVGCYVPKTIDSIKEVIPVFHSIRTLFETQDENNQLVNNIELVLFTDGFWNQATLNKELRGLIMDMGLENFIRLENKLMPLKNLEMLDVLIGLEYGEPIYDYEINALSHNIPIISPRTSSRGLMLIINQKGKPIRGPMQGSLK
jgi:hypothetical protein